MVRHVPDEIIHEILSPGLAVADEVFTAISSRSPRSSTESSSAILLVSKSWLRVATPLLYHTVFLRSKGQAQALAKALRANPNLGRFIRKLRVEGGYAISMHKVLQAAKNLTDICFGFRFEHGDNVCGLSRGLPLINPVRVVLAHEVMHSRIGEQGRKFLDVLAECIPKWSNLTTFEMPHYWQHIPEHRANLSDYFSEQLKVAPNLRTLVLFDYEIDLFSRAWIPRYMETIAQNPSLQEIRPQAPPSRALGSEFLATVQGDARLATLIDIRLFGLSDHPFICPPQLAANPELADAIWDRILGFLFRSYTPNDDTNQPDRMSPLLVCKQFARLSIPHLYENLCIRWSHNLPLLSQRLMDEPSLGLHVRRLFLFAYGHAEEVEGILRSVPNLQGLTSNGHADNTLSWKLFDDLSSRVGATLDIFRGFPVKKSRTKINPAIFSRFERIRTVTWDCQTSFHTSAVPNDALRTLTDLTISKADSSFLIVLSQMRLPSFRRLSFMCRANIDALLNVHGDKIEDLSIPRCMFDFDIFNHCPSLRVLTVNSKIEDDSDELLPFMGAGKGTKLGQKHVSLECIVLHATYYSSWKEHVRIVEKFLTSFDATPFPTLREIQHPAFHWDLSEKELRKSPWIHWAEKFRDDHNIHLVSRRGAQWRLRRLFEPKKVNKKTRR